MRTKFIKACKGTIFFANMQVFKEQMYFFLYFAW